MASTLSSIAPRWLAPRWLALAPQGTTYKRTELATPANRRTHEGDGPLPIRLGSARKPIESLKTGPALFRQLMDTCASGPGRTIHLVSRGPAAHAWADELAKLDSRHAVRVDIVLDGNPRSGKRGACAPLAAVTALSQRAIAVRLLLTPKQALRASRKAPVLESLVRDAAARGARDVIVTPHRSWPWQRGTSAHEKALDLLRLRHGLPRNDSGRG